MGLYLNPNNAAFQANLNLPIYVDKSMLIDELNKFIGRSDNFLCISRPRRFGKSIAGNMIAAYYSKGADSQEMFSNLKIAQTERYEKYLNKLNVIKIDFNGFLQKAKDKNNIFGEINDRVRSDFVSEYPNIMFATDDSIGDCILKVYDALQQTFVIIIDEYDVFVREKVSKKIFEQYLTFLSSLFKDGTLRPAIALAYLTGILPIVRDQIQSKMNEFDEYSMLDAAQLTEFVGFTTAETQELCQSAGMNFEECKRWYDGYEQNNTEIYSPKSVITAMQRKTFGSYWTATGSFEALRDYILMNFEGIKDDVITMIGGGRVGVNVLKYMNTMADFNSKDDVFTYLIHLGYLTYDRIEKMCYIPNSEIRTEWVNSIEDSPDYKPIMQLINASKKLLQSTIEKDAAAVATALNEAHMRATNPLTYNNEASFQSAIGLAYFYANTKYTIVKELPTGKGYADLALIPYVPNIPAMIIELKNNKTAIGAINQIKERHYDDILQHYRGQMLFVGINYDAETKEHTCEIEEFEV